MKRKLVVLLAFAFGMGGSALVAQPDPTWETGGVYNGRAWQGWTEGMRLGYIDGYIEGADAVIGLQNIDLTDKANAALTELWPAGMKYGEIIHALDRFYEDPLNLRIPIHTSLYVITLAARGDSTDSVDAFIRHIRSIAAKDTK